MKKSKPETHININWKPNMKKSKPETHINIRQSELIFKGIQIKSLEIFREFSKSVDKIEKISGIHSVKITFEDVFICPDIDFRSIYHEMTPMENLLYELIEKLRNSNEKNNEET